MSTGTDTDSAGPVRVVIVDDSATMLSLLRAFISRDPNLTVVGTAESAQAARSVIKTTDPDVLVLDLEMPEVNGLEFLGHLMRLRPMPVVVFSGLIEARPDIADKAMQMGAVAVLNKAVRIDGDEIGDLRQALITAGRRFRKEAKRQPTNRKGQVILIGASTGGVAALETVLPTLDRNCPPIVIAQHMPHRFLQSFCSRLGEMVSLRVVMIEHNLTLKSGTVHIAPGDDVQTLVHRKGHDWIAQIVPATAEDAYCPSVERLFSSALPWADKTGAMLLTGLGEDGAKSMKALRDKGAKTIVQTLDTCAVAGMPGSALQIDAADRSAKPEQIGLELLDMMQRAKK